MPVFHYLILLFVIMSTVAGCVTSIPYPHQSTPKISSINRTNSQAVSTKLLSQYIEWQGTPYKMGGLSKKGVDCSGFVYLTFHSKFGYNLPRTTSSQVKIGSTVNRNFLLSGDLLFFKTGLFSRHVGIYLNDSQFIHASTTKGVMISSLKEWYWQKNYWTAKRLHAKQL